MNEEKKKKNQKLYFQIYYNHFEKSPINLNHGLVVVVLVVIAEFDKHNINLLASIKKILIYNKTKILNSSLNREKFRIDQNIQKKK